MAQKKRKADLPEEKSRALLLDAAKKLFGNKGFNGTTVREIAQEAGVNLSLVSYYFEGKEGLYRTCLDQFGQARLSVAQRILAPVDTRSEFRLRLRMAIEEILNAQLQEPDLAQMIHREIEADLPIAKETFEGTFLKIFDAWVGFFEHARKERILRPEISPFILAQLIQGVLNYLVRVDTVRCRYFHQSIREPKHREELIENIVGIFLSGSLEDSS